MRIAVISDTHDRLPPGLPACLRGAEEIWHLGDVCAPGLLAALVSPGVPVSVVRGNCDGDGDWPLELTQERGGVKFYLTHIPCRRAPAGVQAVLHGHTHVPRDEVVGGVRWLNPGCISRPRGQPPGFAWLTFRGDGSFDWKQMVL